MGRAGVSHDLAVGGAGVSHVLALARAGVSHVLALARAGVSHVLAMSTGAPSLLTAASLAKRPFKLDCSMSSPLRNSVMQGLMCPSTLGFPMITWSGNSHSSHGIGNLTFLWLE
jgi:hypothetical protein